MDRTTCRKSARLIWSVCKSRRMAQQIDQLLLQAARANKSAYDGCRRLIYANPAFQKPVTDANGQVTGLTFDSDAAYAAFQANTGLGMTADDLGAAARVTKAMINQFQPGVVVDDVPPALLFLPKTQADIDAAIATLTALKAGFPTT